MDGRLYLIIYGLNYIHQIDLDVPMQDKWIVDRRYASLNYCYANQGELFIVERPVIQILGELPEAFKGKKFGS